MAPAPRPAPSPFARPVRRGRWLPALIVLASLAAARAEDEPAPDPVDTERVLLAEVVSDPEGEATRLVREGVAALADEEPERAFESFVTLAERQPGVLVPVSLLAPGVPGRADGALRWRARRVANHALVGLPEALRERLERRWGAASETLWTRALRGDEPALAELAQDYGATRRGAAALLLLAERLLEDGRDVQAARHLQTWLELNPAASRAVRAGVLLRLVDALARGQDAGGLASVALTYRDLRDVSVPVGGRRLSMADRLAEVRSPVRAQDRSTAGTFDATALAAPGVLWTRSIADPDVLEEGRRPAGMLAVNAGAWVQGQVVVLHEGRTVRRLDLLTGLERWHFPTVRQPTIHDLRDRYRSYDLPFRGVTAAPPGRVLVVLGEPAATGRYGFRGREYDATKLGQASRTRLVCLDLETGQLVWTTGGADAVHPVLGHAGTGCASPPLVAGDRIYCIFAHRFGATTFHLACLDLDTGRPLWVTPLAAGQSGRSDDRASDSDRFTGAHVRANPWGARPSLAGGEICVLPHAGFAAGVDARTGSVRWLRALPRYDLDVLEPASSGHSARNEPLPWGDAWLIAPMDSPRLLCLARGSGDLRWQRGGATPADPPGWRHLLAVGPVADGRTRMRLSGWRPVTLDPADGSLHVPEHLAEWIVDADDPGGRPLDTGSHLLRVAAGALQVQAWAPAAGAEPTEHLLAEPGCPAAGDLYRSGDLLLLIGRERVAALAPPETLFGLRAAIASGVSPPTVGGDAAGRAAGLGLLAALDQEVGLLGEAVRAAEHVSAGALRGQLHALLATRAAAVAGGLEETEAGAEAWGELVAAVAPLPAVHRAQVELRAANVLLAAGADRPAVRLLLGWIEKGEQALVAVRPPGASATAAYHLRGDLLAGEILRRHLDRPAVRELLAARETGAEARLQAAQARGEDALRAALRRAAGTRAAAQARRGLMGRLAAAGRYAQAAALAADLRLDPPWLDPAEDLEARLRRAARLQLDEAGWRGLAYDDLRARTLVADLARWGPGGVQDAQGRTQSMLGDELRRTFGWHPVRASQPPPLDLWRGLSGPRDRDEVRSVEPLALKGPGARRHDDRIVLVRGLTAELWSIPARSRLAHLPGPDEGWFGGNLTGVEPWVPGGGILVRSTVAGEPADHAGIRAGDWVREWNGRAVDDLPTFMNLVAASRPGVPIPIEVRRAGRQALPRFTPGRRPPGQGRMLDYETLWADEEGRILLPGRTGLSWIDARAWTRETAWSWKEPGVVRAAQVHAGRAYVVIRRGLYPDLVVAVDPYAGREVWRREVPGTVSWTSPVGSALWIQTVEPAYAWIVDLQDGSPRGRWRCCEFDEDEFRKNWAPDSPAAVAAGRGFLVTGGPGPRTFRVVNTTTGRVEHEEPADVNRSRTLPVNPQVAAGAYAARVRYVPRLRGGGLRLTFPDPLGGTPRTIDVDPRLLMAEHPHYGPLDNDARAYVRGGTLYVVRVPEQGRRNVNVSVLGVDYGALPRPSPTDADAGGRAVRMRTSRIWIGESRLPSRFVTQVQPRFEGIFVCAARLTGEHRAEDWWIAALGPDEEGDNRDVRLRLGECRDARRSLPVLVGARLLVPTDEGVAVFPARLYGD